jgi:hypothetical protein
MCKHINPFGRYYFDLSRMRQDLNPGSEDWEADTLIFRGPSIFPKTLCARTVKLADFSRLFDDPFHSFRSFQKDLILEIP